MAQIKPADATDKLIILQATVVTCACKCIPKATNTANRIFFILFIRQAYRKIIGNMKREKLE